MKLFQEFTKKGSMNTNNVGDFFDESAEKQIPRLTKNMGLLVEEVLKLTKAAKGFTDELNANSTFQQFVANMAKLAEANKQLSNTVVDVTGNLQQLGRAQKEFDNARSTTAEKAKSMYENLGKESKGYLDTLKKTAEAEAAQAKKYQEIQKVGTEMERQRTEAKRQSLLEDAKAQNQRVADAKVNTESGKQQVLDINKATAATKEQIAEINLRNKLQKEADDMQKRADKEAAAVAKASSEYAKLAKEYKEAQQAAKDLGAQEYRLKTELAAMSQAGAPTADIDAKKAEIANLTPVLTEAQKKAFGLHEALYKIEIAVGQGQRKVGQYSEAARGLRDILRDSPAFAFSFATGVEAISNNIPQLTDGITQLIKTNKELVAAGEKPISIFKTLGKELFSIPGLISLATAAFTIFVARMQMANHGAKSADDSLEEYNAELQKTDEQLYKTVAAETAHASSLLRTAANTELAMKTRVEAIEELKKSQKGLLDNYENEIFLSGKVTEVHEKITEAIYKEALAKAYGEKAAAATSKVVNLTSKGIDKDGNEALSQIEAAAQKMKETGDKLSATDKAYVDAGKPFNPQTSLKMSRYLDARKAYQKLNEELAKAMNEVNMFHENEDKALRDLENMKPKKGKGTTIDELEAELRNVDSELQNKRIPAKAADFLASPESAKDVKGLTLKKILDEQKVTDDQARAVAALIDKKKSLTAQIKLLKGESSDHEGKSGARADLGREFEGEKHLIEAIEALYKHQIEASATAQKAIMDDTDASLQDRLDAYENYYFLLEKMAEGDKDRAIAIEEAKIKENKEKIRLNGQKNGTNLSPSELRSTQMEIEASQVNILAITKQFEAKRAELAVKGAAEVVKIQKDEAAKRIEAIKDLTNNIDVQEQAALQVLVDKLAAGELTYKQYTKKKQALEDEYARKRTDSVIQYLEDEVKALEAQGVDVRALVDKLNEYKVKAAAAANKQIEDKNSKKKNPLLKALGLDEEEWSSIQQIGQQAVQLVDEVVKAIDARYQRELDRITELKAAREKAAQDEIAVVNKAFMNQKQKDEKIGEIQGKLAYDKKVMDREERELKRKMAVADKAASVAKIVEGTAVAVINAMSIPPPFGQILAGIVAATGAVQLANVIATPLPAYKEGIGIRGRGMHPGGWALVGEAGPELVVDRGRAQVVDKPTIIDLARDARVIPEAKLMENVHLLSPALSVKVDAGGRQGERLNLDVIADRLEHAVARIPGIRYAQSPLGVWGKTASTAVSKTTAANRNV